MRPHMLRAFLLVPLLVAACDASEQDAPPSGLVRTIRIPVQYVEDATPGRPLEQHPERLTMTRGAEDELPEGPLSFDVADDGVIVVSDPLRLRLVFYDSLGTYLEERPVGFAATGVTLLGPSRAVEAVSALTDQRYVAERGKVPQPVAASVQMRSAAPLHAVTFDRARNQGRLSLRGAQGTRDIAVTLATPERTLASMELLGTNRRGSAVVALETTRGGARVDVKKQVRIYGTDGRLRSTIADIPLDYFVYPEEGFRVRGNRLYQLLPKEDAVLILVWDTN